MRAHRFPASAMIDRAMFDDDAGTLAISFRLGDKYVYHDVPATIFEALCHANSAGAFFNEHIKDRYRFRRNPGRRRYGPGN